MGSLVQDVMNGKLFTARYLGGGFVPCVPARDLTAGEVCYYVGMGLLCGTSGRYEFEPVAEETGETEDDDC